MSTAPPSMEPRSGVEPAVTALRTASDSGEIRDGVAPGRSPTCFAPYLVTRAVPKINVVQFADPPFGLDEPGTIEFMAERALAGQALNRFALSPRSPDEKNNGSEANS